MTNERSLPQARPEGNPAGGPVCPSPQMLAEYLDGKLDATQRGRIEDHISRCEDCYFVVKETTVTLAEIGVEAPGLGGADAPGRGALAVGSPRHRRLLAIRSVLPIAAMLIVALGSLAPWRQAHPTDAYSDAVKPLVEAVGSRRLFEPRLSGGFRFGPLLEPRRGLERSPGIWAIWEASERLKKSIGAPRSTIDRGALAAAQLLLGEADEAVLVLQAAVAGPSDSQADRALVLADLAAAYLVRATSKGTGADDLLAVETSRQALVIDPTRTEALYNLAIALERVGRGAEALEAWDRAIASERDPGWREEARRRRSALSREISNR